jgi:hypothetical protein
VAAGGAAREDEGAAGKRGRGEKLEVFNHEKFPRFRDIVQYFSNEVPGDQRRVLVHALGGSSENLAHGRRQELHASDTTAAVDRG